MTPTPAIAVITTIETAVVVATALKSVDGPPTGNAPPLMPRVTRGCHRSSNAPTLMFPEVTPFVLLVVILRGKPFRFAPNRSAAQLRARPGRFSVSTFEIHACLLQ